MPTRQAPLSLELQMLMGQTATHPTLTTTLAATPLPLSVQTEGYKGLEALRQIAVALEELQIPQAEELFPMTEVKVSTKTVPVVVVVEALRQGTQTLEQTRQAEQEQLAQTEVVTEGGVGQEMQTAPTALPRVVVVEALAETTPQHAPVVVD